MQEKYVTTRHKDQGIPTVVTQIIKYSKKVATKNTKTIHQPSHNIFFPVNPLQNGHNNEAGILYSNFKKPKSINDFL